MLHRIRDVRKARGLTLDEVAKACTPPKAVSTYWYASWCMFFSLRVQALLEKGLEPLPKRDDERLWHAVTSI